jgi:hypothetical protein
VIEEKSFRLMPMLTENTRGSKVLCELGAGIFRLFRHYHEDVETKIGIELVQTYIDALDCSVTTTKTLRPRLVLS